MNTTNKLTYTSIFLLFTLLNLSCVKQYNIDNPNPRLPLLRNMYLHCNSNLDPAIKDFISFTLFDKNHCIAQGRVEMRIDCRILESQNQIDLGLFNCIHTLDLEEKFTLGLHSLSPLHDLENIQSGDYIFYDGMQELKSNEILVSLHFKPISKPDEKSHWKEFPVFSSTAIQQDANSFFRVLQVDTFHVQSNLGIRMHYEFTSKLQDSLGRVILINNGLGVNTFFL